VAAARGHRADYRPGRPQRGAASLTPAKHIKDPASLDRCTVVVARLALHPAGLNGGLHGKRQESSGAGKNMKVFPGISLGLATLLAVLGSGSEARADSKNMAKGITGGALVGAEVVLITEAALGLEPAWLYVVGGVAGAGGGAVAGHYIGKAVSPKPSSFLLAGGIALIIPAVIGVISATHFQPPDTYKLETSPDDDAPLDAHLELPRIDVAQVFSAEERHEHQLPQATEIQFSLLRGVF
jgi:hypothetical protein